MEKILSEIGFEKEEMKAINGSVVCEIQDGIDDYGDSFALITFFRPSDKKYVQMEVGSHGYIFITEPYDITNLEGMINE